MPLVLEQLYEMLCTSDIFRDVCEICGEHLRDVMLCIARFHSHFTDQQLFSETPLKVACEIDLPAGWPPPPDPTTPVERSVSAPCIARGCIHQQHPASCHRGGLGAPRSRNADRPSRRLPPHAYASKKSDGNHETANAVCRHHLAASSESCCQTSHIHYWINAG